MLSRLQMSLIITAGQLLSQPISNSELGEDGSPPISQQWKWGFTKKKEWNFQDQKRQRNKHPSWKNRKKDKAKEVSYKISSTILFPFPILLILLYYTPWNSCGADYYYYTIWLILFFTLAWLLNWKPIN